jgi:hypothetical protein
MGYYSDISGELEVSYNDKAVKEYSEELLSIAARDGIELPALTNRTGLSKKAIETLNGLDASWWFSFNENSVDASDSESGKAYEFDSQLEEVLEVIRKDNCTANGIFIRRGEEQGDVERFIIQNTQLVRTESAKMVWPDGTEVS